MISKSDKYLGVILASKLYWKLNIRPKVDRATGVNIYMYEIFGQELGLVPLGS